MKAEAVAAALSALVAYLGSDGDPMATLLAAVVLVDVTLGAALVWLCGSLPGGLWHSP